MIGKLGAALSAEEAPASAAPLRAIVIYKTAKAGLQLAAALLLVCWPRGLPQELLRVAEWLRHHVTQGWAAHLAQVIAESSTHRRIVFAIGALALDGVLTAVEAWALHTGRTWGAWLVVATSGSLLPVEVYEFVRHQRWSRVLIFVINALIVGYLARRAWREHQMIRTRSNAHDI